MICLDSSLMVDFLRNKGNAIARIRSLENENIVTTIINVYEFFHLKNKLRDIYFKNNPKMKFWLTKIIAMLIILLYILVIVLRK